MKSLLIQSLMFLLALTNLEAKSESKLWNEKDAGSPNLVNLPNFTPVVDLMDKTVVNVAGTSEVKNERRRPERRPEGPGQGDPSSPEEFFEKFFGMPFEQFRQQPKRTLGSGFIISKDGYILTNNHVIEDTDKIEITLLSRDRSSKKGNTFQAKLVGRDSGTDVALLKIEAGFDLPAAPLADSSKIQKGEWVLAFGNPFGLDHSVSAGIVSATGREISPNENKRFDDFIQTDAAINFGNSGGPLVNMKGEVIGINTAITAQGSGIGFAVPINITKEVITQLKEKGKVSRGYLGVMIQAVSDEMKETFGLKSATGVLVNDIVEGGPASKSNLKRGDVILSVNGKDVTDPKDLQKEVAKVHPGTEALLKVIRNKKMLDVKIKVGDLSETQKAENEDGRAPKESKADKLGIIVGSSKDGSGVIVKDVEQGSPADSQLMPGDLIRKINQIPVSTLSKYKEVVASLKKGQNVVFDIERQNQKLFLAFTLK